MRNGENVDQQLERSEVSYKSRTLMIGVFKFLFFTSIAVIIFFIPLEINGEKEILFGYIYTSLVDLVGIFGLWLITVLILANAILGVINKVFNHGVKWLNNYYKNDSTIHVILYVLGSVFAFLYTLQVTFSHLSITVVITGNNTGGLISGIALAVLFVIPLGAIFIPFFVNYGSIDFIGTLMEPLMRPVFKVPGKSAVDAITSFLTSSSVAVLFTNKLYRMKIYTKKEAMTIATSFSAVSIGFAAVVINTAGLMDHFILVYFLSLLVAFVISIIMVRIPPLSLMSNEYIDGRIQKEEERHGERYNRKTIGLAFSRAIKKAYDSKNFFKEIKLSLDEGLYVLPKVLSMLFAIGVSFMILAEYTKVFDFIGSIIAPLLMLLKVPNAVEIAPSLLLGIAEMFLPVLYIADSVNALDIGARFFVTVISMVQIIFFAETGAVMISIGLPVKVTQLIIIFLIRTLVAIPIVAILMHLLF